jgi:hypothetical protein
MSTFLAQSEWDAFLATYYTVSSEYELCAVTGSFAIRLLLEVGKVEGISIDFNDFDFVVAGSQRFEGCRDMPEMIGNHTRKQTRPSKSCTFELEGSTSFDVVFVEHTFKYMVIEINGVEINVFPPNYLASEYEDVLGLEERDATLDRKKIELCQMLSELFASVPIQSSSFQSRAGVATRFQPNSSFQGRALFQGDNSPYGSPHSSPYASPRASPRSSPSFSRVATQLFA